MTPCSLIISTYNWLPALELCLESIMLQSVLPDEIIIADDGSGKDTTDFIARFSAQSKVPVQHVWQPDEGFQLARIRNKAIAVAEYEYIIQIDGDLILHKDFIKDHLNFQRKGYFTTGSRMLLSPKTTEALFDKKSIDLKKNSKENKNYFNSLRIPFLQDFFSQRYKNKGRHKYYVKGCNMAFWKIDLLKVNGYNEDFSGWGREDSEIAIRLINAGVNKRFLKFGGVCYHLYHKEASRELEERNIRLMNDAIDNKIIRASNGISRYL